MFDFPMFMTVPLDVWINNAMSWIMLNWSGFFNAIGKGILYILLQIEHFLVWLPWPVMVLVVAIVSWRVMQRWVAGIIIAALLLLIGCFGYWTQAMQTLSIVLTAVIICLSMGIPIGICTARSDSLQGILKPVLDAMQTMPSFVYLIPAMMLFGLGKTPAVFATIIYGIPPIIRLTNVGIRQVDPSVVEAAKAFGASPMQILMEVQLPLAIPSILVGINQTTLMCLGMTVIASMIGARGLGIEVLVAINRIDVGKGFTAGLSIVLMAIVIDHITHALAARKMK